MRIMISVIGKLKTVDPRTQLIEEYLIRAKQVGKGLGFSQFGLNVYEAPRGLTGLAGQTKESDLILSNLTQNANLILLDEKGENLSSLAIANQLESKRDQGCSETIFAIGGADGHSQALKQRANKSLSFGKATWPHMLARLMLSEQLYRAMTILSGHPYHRE